MENCNNPEPYNNNDYNNLDEFNNENDFNSNDDSLEEFNPINHCNTIKYGYNLEDNQEEPGGKKYFSKGEDWNLQCSDFSGINNKKKFKKGDGNYKYSKNSTGFVTLYITSCEQDTPTKLSLDNLKKAAPFLNLENTIETEYGLVINLQNDAHVQKLLQMDLAKIFGLPIQVVPLFSGSYLKIVSFKQIPWCIRVEEIENCLKKQGIKYGRISREKSTLYIEVTDFPNYQRLKEEGINFYNSVMFQSFEDAGLNEEVHYNNDDIIQCYRCQGFWHTANTCKQNVRCVRCGEAHQVENCNRPKSSPICCNCRGPHHAAYKLCPVRLKLKKSVRVSFFFDQ